MLLAIAIASCVPAKTPIERGETGAPDTASSDTGVETGAETGSETGDSGVTPLPGSITVEGSYEGVPFGFGCTTSDPPERFVRSWGSAVGDIVGGFGCYDTASLAVTFINPNEGTVTTPSGTDFTYHDESGGVLAWSGPSPTSWSLSLDEVAWVDVETMSLAGSLAGTWAEGEVAATFSLQLLCAGCSR